jgi:hypothetical protein
LFKGVVVGGGVGKVGGTVVGVGSTSPSYNFKKFFTFYVCNLLICAKIGDIRMQICAKIGA